MSNDNEQNEALSQFIIHTVDSHLPGKIQVASGYNPKQSCFETLYNTMPQFVYKKNSAPGTASAWMDRYEELASHVSKSLNVQIDDETKVLVAKFKLQSLGDKWFLSIPNAEGQSKWTSFKKEFLKRFDPTVQQGTFQMFALQQGQHQSLEEYYQDFLGVVTPLYQDRELDEIALYCFLRGLWNNDARDYIVNRRAAGRDVKSAIESVIQVQQTRAMYIDNPYGQVGQDTSDRQYDRQYGSQQERQNRQYDSQDNNGRKLYNKRNNRQNLGPVHHDAIDDLSRKINELTLKMEELRSNPNPRPQERANFFQEVDEHAPSDNFQNFETDGEFYNTNEIGMVNEEEEFGENDYWDFTPSPSSAAMTPLQALQAEPMEIDAPRAEPRDNRGRFTAGAVPVSLQNTQNLQRQARTNAPTNGQNATNRSGQQQQAAGPRRAPQNPIPAPIPTQTLQPRRREAREAPRLVQNRNTIGDIPLGGNSARAIARRIVESALNTTVALKVDHLSGISPAVQQEMLQAFNRAEQSNLSETIPGLYEAQILVPTPPSLLSYSNPARVPGIVNGVPMTVIIDSGCSNVMMGLRAIREANLLDRVDRTPSRLRQYQVANGAIETAFGVVRQVDIGIGPASARHDVTVCASDTNTVLLGNSYLAKIYAKFSVHEAMLTVTGNDLQTANIPIDYSGSTNIHEIFMIQEIPSVSISSQESQRSSTPEAEPSRTRSGKSYNEAPKMTHAQKTIRAASRDLAARAVNTGLSPNRHMRAPPGFGHMVERLAKFSRNGPFEHQQLAREYTPPSQVYNVESLPPTAPSRAVPGEVRGFPETEALLTAVDPAEKEVNSTKKVTFANKVDQILPKSNIPGPRSSRSAEKLVSFENDEAMIVRPSVPNEARTARHQIHPHLFKSYNDRYGPFEIDACCDPHGLNAQLPAYWTTETDCTKQDWAHKRIYAHPDHDQVLPTLKRYLECFATSPNDTSALFVVPDFPEADWWSLLAQPHFALVGYYPANSNVCLNVGGPSGPDPELHFKDVCGQSYGIMIFLHSKVPPETPVILGPHSGFWPPTSLPTVPVRASWAKDRNVAKPNAVEQVTVDKDIQGLQAELSRYEMVFATEAKDLGDFRWMSHVIDVQEALPIKQKSRKYSPEEQRTLKAEVDDLLKAGIIRESMSPWRSNPLFVPKPDGSVRMCIDYRQLNEVTVTDAYPMQRTTDIFDSLGQAYCFSVIDLKSGFH